LIDNFLLSTETAVMLYEKFAKNAPILDYHCHLSAKEIYEDVTFTDITSMWLQYDHYKWRALRYAGVPEKYITGDSDSIEKFKFWAKISSRLIGCPLYHWTNMELKTYFGVPEILNENNAVEIFHYCNEQIETKALSPVKMILKSNVKLICTTDDPIDSLEYHQGLKEKESAFKVLPTFRPDKALNLRNAEYLSYLDKLMKITDISIDSFPTFIKALKKRVNYFAENGCLFSDHSLESLTLTVQDEKEVDVIFKKVLRKETISFEDAEKFKNQTLIILAGEYTNNNMAMQLHIGALRNNNPKMFEKIGPDSGFDIMNDFPVATVLSDLLGKMNNCDSLPKTILYTHNNKDNLVLSTLPQCFCVDSIPGKVQFGAAWWLVDNKKGIQAHLQTLANQGMLADFIGMLTDSRSFLSYVRHDYFRRILCDFIGNLVETGEFENDMKTLQNIVEGVCYKNIINYIGDENDEITYSSQS